MIKVATGFFIPTEEIVFVGVNETLSVKRKVKALKEKGNFFSLEKNKRIKSIIFYIHGGTEYGVSSPLACETILLKMEEENGKKTIPKA